MARKVNGVTLKTRKQIRDSVQRGERWLDKEIPGWFRKVDIKKLNLADSDSCMLGQTAELFDGVFGNYYDVEDKYGRDFCNARGFVRTSANHHAEYSYLTELWRTRTIKRRLQGLKPNGRAAQRLIKQLTSPVTLDLNS